MKLALVENGVASCLVCSWHYKAPASRKNWKSKQEEQLSPEERATLLEKVTLAHLRTNHDRLMLSKEELGKEKNRTYYCGRRPERGV